VKRTPLGRPGMCEYSPGALLFLVSRAAGYVSGQILCVDGGSRPLEK
jgi:NAD(P)-dependent dehydrogenase (short-subunit alcohol dehydrogenase family)